MALHSLPENPSITQMKGAWPAVKRCSLGLMHWLRPDVRTLPDDRFVPIVDIHEQYLDWATRRGYSAFSQRVVGTTLTRFLGCESERYGAQGRQLRYLVGPLSLRPTYDPPRGGHGIAPEDFPWVQYLRHGMTGLPDSEIAAALEWSESNGWKRPPQLGWPVWRIPLPGEVVPTVPAWETRDFD